MLVIPMGYRVLSHDLATPIARGRTAEIFAWGDQHVLKLFLAGWPATQVKYEAKVACAVQASGFPMPAARAIFEHEGRYGIIYERVAGVSLLRMITSQPWRILHAARVLARLHVTVHDYQVTVLPSQRERMGSRIAANSLLPETTRERLLALLATMPEGDRLCHGDFHPDNVLLTAHGPVIIDWNDATRGVSAADFARTTLLMRDSILPRNISGRRMLGLFRSLFYRLYRQQYRRLRPQVVEDAAHWAPIIAAVRLSEDVEEGEEHRLLQLTETAGSV